MGGGTGGGAACPFGAAVLSVGIVVGTKLAGMFMGGTSGGVSALLTDAKAPLADGVDPGG